MAPTEFHRFKDLPIETRLKIWLHLVEQCRVRLPKIKQEPNGNKPFRFKSYSPRPALLSVNRESFGVASQFYSRIFEYQSAALPPPDFAKTWFDYERDILYLCDHIYNSGEPWIGFDEPDCENSSFIRAINRMPRSDCHKVQNLALDIDNFYQSNAPSILAWILGKFGGVKNLYLSEVYLGDDIDLEGASLDAKDIQIWDAPTERQAVLRTTYELIIKGRDPTTAWDGSHEKFRLRRVKELRDGLQIEQPKRKKLVQRRQQDGQTTITSAGGLEVNSSLHVWEMPRVHFNYVIAKDLEQEMKRICRDYFT